MNDKLLQLSPADNIFVARCGIRAGEELAIGGQNISVETSIPLGFKVAARDIAAGEKILKYGAPIGSAKQAIRAGEIVHTHNMQSDYLPTYDREQGRFVDEH
jgi:altronate dehydratase small subunit